MLLILFAGGFMRSVDHIALASYLTSSVHFLLIPILIWTAYLLYTSNFNAQLLKLPENTFTVHFVLLPARHQWIAGAQVAAIQLLPTLLYGLFLIIVSIRNETSFSAVMVCIVLSVHLLIAATLLRARFIRPDFEQRGGLITQWVSKNVIRPFVVFCVEWSVRRQPLQIIGLKVIGLALIWTALYLFETDTYDLRLAGLGVTFAFSLNVAFVFAAHEFVAMQFPLFRQMPFSLFQRWYRILVVLAIFTTPELAVLIRNIPEPFNPLHSILLYGFGISMNILVFTFLYARNNMPEKSMPGIYAFLILTFVLVLGKVPLEILTVGNGILSFVMMWFFYYRYEPEYGS